jgi:hypothetical protein
MAMLNYEQIIEKLRRQYIDYAHMFPIPITVPGKNTSSQSGPVGLPLAKYHCGVTMTKKDTLAAKAYSKKIGHYFKKYHLGIACAKILFRDIATTSFDYFNVCDTLFRSCITDKEYIKDLYDVLRVF